jgi:CBS domain-containing protein
MLVKEILRIKGHTLFTTSPEGLVVDAVKVMAQHDIGSLVVMDHGRMAGILTFAEVLRALSERNGTLGDAHISDHYQRDPLTATPNIDVMELRRTMLERHARYVPVVENGTLLGVVSFHDVAKAIYDEASREKDALMSYINS